MNKIKRILNTAIQQKHKGESFLEKGLNQLHKYKLTLQHIEQKIITSL